ncbi:glycosyltransferase family 2 protein [Methylobacillus gramineus]|uniref:glycosyltransferase family 2 protein n=1 Tax=Methylobacillus gramineus TaxID=755169 RepID=UPI001CFFC9B9|nr:glycosyltransferase family 2 protein [Methylobacillus gramineus]MCB5183694.1 glycosyltransferase family 2 protein [Methylobacillus gramineus]
MFSVVIPLYNKEAFIERALNSVLQQTLSDYEVIVVDDGSSDGSMELVSQFDDDRIRVIQQENAGVAAARNTGIAAAGREWVAFLDADDVWMPDHLQELQDLINAFPKVTSVGTAYNKIDTNGRVQALRYPPQLSGQALSLVGDYFAVSIAYDHVLHSSSAAARKSVLLQISGFPVGVKSGEDLITWAKLALAGDMAFSSKVSAVFYIPDQQAINRVANIRRPAIPDRVGEELAELSRKFQRPSLSRYLSLWHEIRAVLFTELNERSLALRELKLSMQFSGLRKKHIFMLLALLMPARIRGVVFEKIRHYKKKSTQ